MNRILSEKIKPWLQETPAHFHYVWYVNVAVTTGMAEQCDFGFKTNIMIIRDEFLRYGYNEHDMTKTAKLIFERQKENSNYTQTLIEKWNPIVAEFYDLCNELDSTDLSILSKSDLVDIYKKFIDIYIKEYSLPLVTDAIGTYLEHQLKELVEQKLNSLNRTGEFNKIIAGLSAPIHESFLGEEKLDLMNITKKYLSKENVDLNLKNHSEKWYWIQNNYHRSLNLDEKYFLERIKEHAQRPKEVSEFIKNHVLEFDQAKKEKERISKELSFGEDLLLTIKLAEEHSIWQDKRKKANLRAQEYITRFLKEFSKRTTLPFKTLLYMTGYEIIDYTLGNKIDVQEIEKRKKFLGLIFTPEDNSLLSYEDALLLEKDLNDFDQSEIFGDIHGTVANLGHAVGEAKIIKRFDEFDKMNQGDILITNMTRPEFIPVMKKAAAIVTDEGSITCHAAIVSRELGIPCIIGTKVGTKILKDGDTLEVNANHGIVRKIE